MGPSLLLGMTLSSAAPREAPANVVLIVMDALRPDHLGSYGYSRPTSPNLDQLSHEGIVFTNAVAQANWTLPSLASLMTSLYPAAHGARGFAPELSDDPQWGVRLFFKRYVPSAGKRLSSARVTLAEVLRDADYHTAAFTATAFGDPSFGLNQGFDHYRYGYWDRGKGAPMRTLVRSALDHIRPRRDGRWFLYVHGFDAHAPYETPEGIGPPWDSEYRGPVDGKVQTLRKIVGGELRLAPRDREHLLALYDGCIAYMDKQLGELFSGLKSAGLWDNTLIAVTADHGEAFLEHGALQHGNVPYDEVLKVPLILRLPGGPRGRKVGTQVRLIDVMPTLLDYLGVRAPSPMQGVSLRPFIEGRADQDLPAFSESSPIGPGGHWGYILRTGRWKYVQWQDGHPPELYDLRRDPREGSNLAGERPRIAQELRTLLEAWRRETAAVAVSLPPVEGGRPPLSPDLRQKLKKAGYLP